MASKKASRPTKQKKPVKGKGGGGGPTAQQTPAYIEDAFSYIEAHGKFFFCLFFPSSLRSRGLYSSLPSFIILGLQVQGLFRISGPVAEVQALKKSWDTGKATDLSKISDISVITSALKVWSMLEYASDQTNQPSTNPIVVLP